MKKLRVGVLMFALLFPLLIGIISAAISSQGMEMYAGMAKPPLSPPAWVFTAAWSVLYLMMGLASYFIIVSESDGQSKIRSLFTYAVQLGMNFFWSIIFFNWGMYRFAFIWLIIMWFIVIRCAFRFFRIRKIAGWLLIPYILWLAFAAYLNMGAYVLSVSGQ